MRKLIERRSLIDGSFTTDTVVMPVLLSMQGLY